MKKNRIKCFCFRKWISISILGLIACAIGTGCNSTIEVQNTGKGIIEVSTDTSHKKIRLGENGVGHFVNDKEIFIEDIKVCFDRNIEITNTGNTITLVKYMVDKGEEKAVEVAAGDTISLEKNIPITIGDACILYQ